MRKLLAALAMMTAATGLLAGVPGPAEAGPTPNTMYCIQPGACRLMSGTYKPEYRTACKMETPKSTAYPYYPSGRYCSYWIKWLFLPAVGA